MGRTSLKIARRGVPLGHAQPFFDRGLFILDEPEAALSPLRQLALLARIHELANAGSQFIVATHSPIQMGYPNADILLLSEDGIRRVEYEETEHFRITKSFLNNRAGMLRELLGESEPVCFVSS